MKQVVLIKANEINKKLIQARVSLDEIEDMDKCIKEVGVTHVSCVMYKSGSSSIYFNDDEIIDAVEMIKDIRTVIVESLENQLDAL